MQYPESWVAFELPEGNHGDREEIVAISVPGRTWPNFRIAKQNFVTGDVDQVIQWGVTRIDKIKGIQPKDITIGKPTPIKTSTLSGKYLTYSYTSVSLIEEKEVVCHSYFFYKNESGYMASLCSDKDSWEKLGDVESKMIASLSFP